MAGSETRCGLGWCGAVGELHCGDGVGEGLCAGAFLCGWWGRCLGHLVVRLLWGFRFLQFCADGGENVWEGGLGGGVGCRIVPGDVLLLWVLGVLLYDDVGGGVVFRCPWVRIVVEGWRVMLWRCFQLWNARRAWRPCLVSPGGRG